ncbi:PREDICTED: peroxidase 27-like [Nelumbo nucifera]|uniref:Peroxidase n=2 Tax=Nelumbo nucifera TaxID=4432 RepID=A0A822Y8Z0_NELNU|nr:PREDICTED: peroxidase 27-like [Nelumbo nucifera]DAD28877.1 TPA_asm: hypothetical protein HUJ06_030345 [Nelumbo nucifera]
MATLRLFQVFLQQLFMVVVLSELAVDGQSLQVGFYRKTCPPAEAIIRNTTTPYILEDPSLAAPLLRVQFHDCFVRGCDGSVLLDSTENNETEKASGPNQSLRGFHVIDAVKAAVEEACPGVVSCADILALVVRDAVFMLKGPFWEVPTGRRDGRVSIDSEITENLPPPSSNITRLKTSFKSKGLSTKDLVVLSGAHTIGRSHCSIFSDRLYNFSGRGDTDPSLDPKYAIKLKKKCKRGDVTTVVELDPGSFKTFNKDYYKVVAEGRGIFQSDAALLDDNETRDYVISQAASAVSSTFLKDFAEAMINLGNIGVITGTEGEIRKRCAFVNF